MSQCWESCGASIDWLISVLERQVLIVGVAYGVTTLITGMIIWLRLEGSLWVIMLASLLISWLPTFPMALIFLALSELVVLGPLTWLKLWVASKSQSVSIDPLL